MALAKNALTSAMSSWISTSWVPTWSARARRADQPDRKSTRLNSSHTVISYAVFCLKKKKEIIRKNLEVAFKSGKIALRSVVLVKTGSDVEVIFFLCTIETNVTVEQSAFFAQS